MKNISTIASAIVLAFAVMTQGFQCGSPEFSGAKLRIQQKDYKGAIALLEKEVQKNPTNEDAWFLLGELDADQGDYAGMNIAFAQTLKLSDKHAVQIHNMRYNRWGQHVNDGVSDLSRASADSMQFYDSAVNQFKMAEEIWPDTSLTYKYLGIAYYNKADFPKSLAAFREAWERGKDLESLKRVGAIYFSQGMKLDDKFETVNADSLRILKRLGEIKTGVHKNDVMAAFGAPDEVKKMEAPRSKKRRKKAEVSSKEQWTYKNLGLTLEVDGERVVGVSKAREPKIDSTYHLQALAKYDSAESVFENVKQVNPKDNDNLNLLLQAYVKSGRIKEAIQTFQIAVTNDPNNKINHYILGILFRTDGEFEQAIAEFKTALSLDPGYNDALYDVGATLYNWGVQILKDAEAKGIETVEYKAKFEAALPYLEKVSSAKKDEPQVFETLGTIYARLGEKDKAMKAFDEADWLHKHYELKLGMKEDMLSSVLGLPDKKEDTTFENKPASTWTYSKEGVSFVVADGVVKDWTRTAK
jgi:tetratricopeptide (TPR) repeat protein